MKSLTRCTIALLAAAGTAACAMAQPAEQPDGGARGTGRERIGDRIRERMDDRAPDAATLKQRLQKRMEENQKASERLKAAIEKLEKGGDINEIMRDMDQGRPTREGGREGGPGDRHEGGPMGPEGGPGREPGRPGGGPGGGPGGSGPVGPMNAAEREELNKFINKHMPKVAERMRTFASLEPEAADRMTVRMAPRIRELMALEHHDPKLFTHRVDEMRAGFEIIASSRDLSDLIRSNGSAQDIASAENRIRAAVRDRIEAQVKGQEAEIESLAKRVESLREHLKDRTTSKEDRIAEEANRVIERARDPESRGPRNKGEGRDGKRESEKPEPR